MSKDRLTEPGAEGSSGAEGAGVPSPFPSVWRWFVWDFVYATKRTAPNHRKRAPPSTMLTIPEIWRPSVSITIPIVVHRRPRKTTPTRQ